MHDVYMLMYERLGYFVICARERRLAFANKREFTVNLCLFITRRREIRYFIYSSFAEFIEILQKLAHRFFLELLIYCMCN